MRSPNLFYRSIYTVAARLPEGRVTVNATVTRVRIEKESTSSSRSGFFSPVGDRLDPISTSSLITIIFAIVVNLTGLLYLLNRK